MGGWEGRSILKYLLLLVVGGRSVGWQHLRILFTFLFQIHFRRKIHLNILSILKFRTHPVGLNVLEIYFSQKLAPHCVWMDDEDDGWMEIESVIYIIIVVVLLLAKWWKKACNDAITCVSRICNQLSLAWYTILFIFQNYS